MISMMNQNLIYAILVVGRRGGGLQFASESILLLWYKCSYMCLSGQHFVKKFCICPLDWSHLHINATYIEKLYTNHSGQSVASFRRIICGVVTAFHIKWKSSSRRSGSCMADRSTKFEVCSLLINGKPAEHVQLYAHATFDVPCSITAAVISLSQYFPLHMKPLVQ